MELKEDGEFPLHGMDFIEEFKDEMKDSNLLTGKYNMCGYSFDVMIKKGPQIRKEAYDIMNSFQHNTCIRLLNFYSETNCGSLVIPMVGPLFETWINGDGHGLLIDKNGSMSPLFKTMIIDICDLVERLSKEQILIKNFNRKNLYMAKETTPRILVLVTEAEVLRKPASKIAIWKPVCDVITWCYEECKIKPTLHAQRYIDFICKENFATKKLKNYPENWDFCTKGGYLLCFMAAIQGGMKREMEHIGVSWPTQNGELPPLLKEIIDYESSKGQYYDPKIKFDYINASRNVYKHFDKLPLHIKQGLGGNREGFIKMLEYWTPTIWVDLYDAIGWP